MARARLQRLQQLHRDQAWLTWSWASARLRMAALSIGMITVVTAEPAAVACDSNSSLARL